MGWDISRLALLGLFGALLLAGGIEDVRTREISNRKNGTIALLAPLWWIANGLPVWPDMAMQIGFALAIFALFALAFRFGMMGGGDVKMIAAVALWLPLAPMLAMLTLMAVVGGGVTLAVVIEHRIRKSDGAVEVPYGVAIAIAALLTLREPLLNQFL